MCLCSLCQNLTLAVQKRIFPLSRQWKKCLIKYQEQFKALGIRILHCSSKKIIKYQSSWKFVNAWLMTKLKVKFYVFNFDGLTVQFVELILNLWQKWYVFCYQNCSDLLWEKIILVIEKKLLKFEAEGQEFAKILRSLEQFVQTVNCQNNFW